MHELAVTESLLRTVEEEAKRYQAVKVSEIRITMGELNAFIPECIQEYFELMSEGTPEEGARLVFNIQPAVLECRECNKKFNMEYNRLKCKYCQSVNVNIIMGKEFYIESLDIETDED